MKKKCRHPAKKVFVAWEIKTNAHNFATRKTDQELADAIRCMENKRYECRLCGKTVVPIKFEEINDRT